MAAFKVVPTSLSEPPAGSNILIADAAHLEHLPPGFPRERVILLAGMGDSEIAQAWEAGIEVCIDTRTSLATIVLSVLAAEARKPRELSPNTIESRTRR
jgi:hypothetical protein